MAAAWTSWGRRAGLAAASAVAVLAVFLLFVFTTAPGHALLARMVKTFSGGDVAIAGLAGDLPDHIRAARVELRDAKGVWLRLEDVSLDWHPLALLGGHVDIDRVRAAKVVFLRRQVESRKKKSRSSTRIDVADFAVSRIVLAPAVLGRKAVLTASGSLHYVSRHDLAADIAVRRLDGRGRYEVNAAIVHDVAKGRIAIAESGNGLAGGVFGLPDLGPVTLDVRAGAQGSANTVHLRFKAGLLAVAGDGTLDLARRTANIDFSAASLAMHPSRDLSWKLLSATAHVHGSFERPDINASLKLDDLAANGVRIKTLRAALKGQGGIADLHATADRLRIPGKAPDMLASAPVTLTAHADLQAPTRPVRFAIHHPLFALDGSATTAGGLGGSVSLTLRRLTPLGLTGTGSLKLTARRLAHVTEVNAEGRIAARGRSALARLLGGDARLEARATLADARNLTASASLSGAALSAKLAARVAEGAPNVRADIAVADLSRVLGALTGRLDLHARLNGPADKLLLVVNGDAFAATKGSKREHVAIDGEARGLPGLRDAVLRLSGRFDGAPLALKARLTGERQGALRIALDRATWKSAQGTGSLRLAGAQPQGHVSLKIAHLADLAPLVGGKLGGSVQAEVDFKPAAAAVQATLANLVSGTAKIAKLDIGGRVADPFGKPVLALTLAAHDLAAGGVAGSATATIGGPPARPTVSLASALTSGGGQNFSIVTDAALDTAAHEVTLTKFEGKWSGQTVTLASPATIGYGGGAVAFAAAFTDGKAARLTVSGAVPSKPGAPMKIAAKGNADLGLLTTALAATGQTLRGKLDLDVTVTGSLAKPVAVGTASLKDGQLRDYARGVSLTGIAAAFQAQGGTIRLTHFTAKAGTGRLEGSGTIDLTAPGMPVDIAFQAKDARPIVSDLVTATMDSDLKLQGLLTRHMTLSGTLKIRKGSINLPQKFPAEVATLDIRRRGTAASPAPQRPARIGLDVTVSSPGRVFVRGRGIEAEFAGDLKLKGSVTRPRAEGALTMRRGTLSLAGTTLTFQSGSIGFNGTALRGRIDPALNFVAQTTANGITATLKVTGTASQPKLELSSSPPLPQDEILAQLLFQQSVKQLSPFQLASMAQAIASLGGVGTGFDPMAVMRRSLGLDRLAVGSTPGANGAPGQTTIEAGKYLLHNVYVGARQDLSGGTKALVQIDLSKHLKVQATVTAATPATAATSTPLQDNGDTIGLSYEFEY